MSADEDGSGAVTARDSEPEHDVGHGQVHGQEPGPATRLPGRPCSVAAALELVGDRWSLLVIRELLLYDNHRFDQIARTTGAPRDRLAARLRDLEAAGVIERRRYHDRPPRFEYHLTRAGRDLAPVVNALRVWGDQWAVDEPPVVFRHSCGHEFTSTTSCGHCGAAMRVQDLTVESRFPDGAGAGAGAVKSG